MARINVSTNEVLWMISVTQEASHKGKGNEHTVSRPAKSGSNMLFRMGYKYEGNTPAYHHTG